MAHTGNIQIALIESKTPHSAWRDVVAEECSDFHHMCVSTEHSSILKPTKNTSSPLVASRRLWEGFLICSSHTKMPVRHLAACLGSLHVSNHPKRVIKRSLILR